MFFFLKRLNSGMIGVKVRLGLANCIRDFKVRSFETLIANTIRETRKPYISK